MTIGAYTGENRRRHDRTEQPALYTEVEGGTYRTGNWSFSGLVLEGYHGKLSPGSLFEIERMGPAEDRMTAVRVRARVLRSEPNGRRLAVDFLDVDERAYGVLRALVSR